MNREILITMLEDDFDIIVAAEWKGVSGTFNAVRKGNFSGAAGYCDAGDGRL